MTADSGRTVIVTGAGTGIGAATARSLAGEGTHVVLVGRRPGPIERVAAEVGGTAIVADASREADVARVVKRTVSERGRLDGLVLNAGIVHAAPVGDLPAEQWRETLDVNLTGPFVLTQAALPHLLAAGGAVVAVASVAAIRSGAGMSAYSASKAGLVALIQGLAVDYGSAGLRANTVCPGWVRTEMADAEMDELGRSTGVDREAAYARVTQDVPQRRAADPDEVAGAIRWLLSADASYVNGAVLTVDGGTALVDVGTLAFAG